MNGAAYALALFLVVLVATYAAVCVRFDWVAS